MIDHGKAEGSRSLHGTAHHARIHHGAAVVGNGDDAGIFHQSNGCEFFARAVLCNGSDGKDVDDGMTLRTFDDVAGDRGIVVYRRRVGHAANGGEASGRGGARSAFDGLGVLKARLAQMNVHIDEAGRDNESRGVDLVCAGGVEILSDGSDAATFDRDVAHRVETAGRVHHAAVANDKFRHGRSVSEDTLKYGHAYGDPIFHLIEDDGTL